MCHFLNSIWLQWVMNEVPLSVLVTMILDFFSSTPHINCTPSSWSMRCLQSEARKKKKKTKHIVVKSNSIQGAPESYSLRKLPCQVCCRLDNPNDLF